MNKIWIVIITYNGMEWLPKCLATTKTYPVIVVDNNSIDGTASYIRNSYPEVILMEQQSNLGFGQANNLGISYALAQGAEAVFLLNQDAYLEKDTLQKLVEIQAKTPEFGILSPVHLDGQGNKLDRNFFYYMAPDANPDFYSDFVLNKSKKEIYEVPFVNAAGWLISKKCLEIVGGFDPLFFHYGEDENFCQRVRYFQFKIGVVPSTFIRHDRQDREGPAIVRGSAHYLERLEKEHKVKFADINKDEIDQLRRLRKSRKSTYFKAFLKMNFKAARLYRKEYKILVKIEPLIKKSRKMNKTVGKSYL